MAFDDLNDIPHRLKVMQFEARFKTTNFQQYKLVLQTGKKGDPWDLFIDEFEWRNEILVKKGQDLVYCKDIRINVYDFTLALLTNLPVKWILQDESIAGLHFEQMKTSLSEVEDMRKKGAPVDEFAMFLIARRQVQYDRSTNPK